MKKLMSLAALALLLAASNGCSVCDGPMGGCENEKFSLGRLFHRDQGCNTCSLGAPVGGCQSCGNEGYSTGTIVNAGMASAPCNCGTGSSVGYSGGTIISGNAPSMSESIGPSSMPSGGLRSMVPGPMSE